MALGTKEYFGGPIATKRFLVLRLAKSRVTKGLSHSKSPWLDLLLASSTHGRVGTALTVPPARLKWETDEEWAMEEYRGPLRICG